MPRCCLCIMKQDRLYPTKNGIDLMPIDNFVRSHWQLIIYLAIGCNIVSTTATANNN